MNLEGSDNGHSTGLLNRGRLKSGMWVQLPPPPPIGKIMSRTIDLRKKVKKEEVSVVRKESLVEEKPKEEAPTLTAAPISEATKRIEWETPSFYYNPQKRYLALVVIALFCGAGAMLFYRMDTLTAIFLILSSLVLILYANKKPTVFKVVVSHAGVTIDDQAYYYKELKSFWLDYSPHGPRELSLEARKWYMPYVKVSIENQNPVEIRSLMINFIAEREHEKSLIDLMSRKIGL